ncbi:MAG TPA: hypothetical protein PK504_09040 [Ferruginibacter sp.]|nr:hypothetical protein [Ferruginibacter sp.]HRE63677.1 hypothetical protein [Ferruginibacter sp.]
MKAFKTFDYRMSIALIIASFVFSIITLDERFLLGYFITGGWQIISMVVHQANGWFTQKGSNRIKYHIAVLLIVVTALLAFALPVILLPLLLILLFAAPIMALYYTHICYNELHVKMQRPASLLK